MSVQARAAATRQNAHPMLRRRPHCRTHIIFVHPAEFLVTGPTGAILSRTILGRQLVVTPQQVGKDEDTKRVFYFDLP